MPTSIEVGRRLRKLRGGETRDDVAAAVGISASTLGMYECGRRMPRDEIKISLAHYFGTTVQALFFNDIGGK